MRPEHAAVAAIALFAAAPALGVDFKRDETGMWLPVGVWSSVAVHGGRTNAVLGLEVSAAYLQSRHGYFFGGYVDAGLDIGQGRGRFSVGPEVGLSFFGLDGGYLVAADGAGLRHGLCGRAFVTIGIAAVFARYGHLLTGPGPAAIGEVGLLLKFPIDL